MLTRQAENTGIRSLTTAKIKDYAQFSKLRLSSLVVFSSFLAYWYGAESINWTTVLYLVGGGFLVTGASNGFNQVIEKDLDRIMKRTSSRPLPNNRMGVGEGILVASVMGVLGLFMLFYGVNQFSGWLGVLAMFMYTMIYTPMKRISPIAVFIGAFPGAIPPMLGYVAATGKFDFMAGMLFAVQFFWQFPHFWAIAWKVDEDYKKAGFSLLPSKGRKDRSSAFLILIYSVFLIPMGLFPFFFQATGLFVGVAGLILGLWMTIHALKLYYSLDDKDATRLMFTSFIYLPLMQIAFVVDKFLFL